MQTERVTFLTSPEGKAAIAARAAASGISVGEFIRRKVEDDAATPEEEAELAALVEQVNEAFPKMKASLDSIGRTLKQSHAEIDAFLREKGIR